MEFEKNELYVYNNDCKKNKEKMKIMKKKNIKTLIAVSAITSILGLPTSVGASAIHVAGAHVGGAHVGGAHVGGAHVGGAHVGGTHVGGGFHTTPHTNGGGHTIGEGHTAGGGHTTNENHTTNDKTAGKTNNDKNTTGAKTKADKNKNTHGASPKDKNKIKEDKTATKSTKKPSAANMRNHDNRNYVNSNKNTSWVPYWYYYEIMHHHSHYNNENSSSSSMMTSKKSSTKKSTKKPKNVKVSKKDVQAYHRFLKRHPEMKNKE